MKPVTETERFTSIEMLQQWHLFFVFLSGRVCYNISVGKIRSKSQRLKNVFFCDKEKKPVQAAAVMAGFFSFEGLSY